MTTLQEQAKAVQKGMYRSQSMPCSHQVVSTPMVAP